MNSNAKPQPKTQTINKGIVKQVCILIECNMIYLKILIHKWMMRKFQYLFTTDQCRGTRPGSGTLSTVLTSLWVWFKIKAGKNSINSKYKLSKSIGYNSYSLYYRPVLKCHRLKTWSHWHSHSWVDKSDFIVTDYKDLTFKTSHVIKSYS